MRIANGWKEYELLDAGDGEKLERWGTYILRRPDPQALWPKGNEALWNQADAHYKRSRDGGGSWDRRSTLPKQWVVSYDDLSFRVELMGFKHTGIFPEQACNWDWIREKIESASEPVRVLNLFGYTGGATVAALAAGGEVSHVDASKGMVGRAKENCALSRLSHAPVRFFADDAIKFVDRELRRGHQYEAILLDPPSFGRGPKGELWKLESHLFSLLEKISMLLSDRALFLLLNAYTTGLSPVVLENMVKMATHAVPAGVTESFELGLPLRREGIVLPCGLSVRWERSHASLPAKRALRSF
ncbi:MAG: class I SAM-dependent methyltransferase [Candidatus Moraniibacteriota bacterium]|nr:MAG: class I SAM-dependent methyltransferase [Candidatus Moranbacteria bacterium]